MIIFPLLHVILLATAEPSDTQNYTMVPEIARSRIVFAVDESTSIEERNEALLEVIERSIDVELRAIAHLNLGISQMEQDDSTGVSLGIESLRAADRSSRVPQLRARSRFELGHLFYQQAKHTNNPDSLELAGDMQAILDSLNVQFGMLKESAGAFRSVFEVVDSHELAISNLERVRREAQLLQNQIDAIEKLIEQQREQQQQQQQKQQDAADKLEELAQEQQSQSDESKSSPPQSEQDQQKQQEEQQNLSDETSTTKDDISEQTEDTQAVQEKIQEAQEAQRRAQEAMDEGDHERASDEQRKAAEALKEAAQKMQEMADKSKEKNEGESDKGEGDKDSQQSDEPQENSEQSEDGEQGDEISEIAKELLDKERREREARQAYRATGRPTKVEKDW